MYNNTILKYSHHPFIIGSSDLMYTGSGYKYIIYVIVALLVAAAVSDPQLTSADKGTPSGSMGVNTVQSSGEKPISQLTPQGKGFDLNNYNLAQSPGIIMVMEKTSFILCQEIPDQVIIPAAIWIYTPGSRPCGRISQYMTEITV